MTNEIALIFDIVNFAYLDKSLPCATSFDLLEQLRQVNDFYNRNNLHHPKNGYRYYAFEVQL